MLQTPPYNSLSQAHLDPDTVGEARNIPNSDSIVGFTDADGVSQEHRRAISGSVILIDGGAVSSSLKKQELVALSTTESEYVATTHTNKEIIWLCRLLGGIFRPLVHQR
jgi:hypothetical protein